MLDHIAKFRAKLNAGTFCLGTGVTFADPAVTEALCDSVDFLWIDLEHNPIGVETLLAHLIAARAGGAPALVRIPINDAGWIKRVLDSGADGIILPQAQSAADVRQFVSACRYPPLGTRGFGPRRPTNYARNGGRKYLDQANTQLFVVAQIETVGALNDVEEICAIEGLDALVVGPYDLSGSMGMLGEVHHPRVLDAIRTVVEKAHAQGLSVGIGMGADADHAREAAALGVNWAQCCNDFEFIVRGATRLYSSIRERRA
jgi:2-dehydro-3-deoxyglucarate aldolase/4-hydroxy-2-oxoheptanedioate aldolase